MPPRLARSQDTQPPTSERSPRSPDAIAPHIGAIDGLIQCDDYKGYGSVVSMPDGEKRILVDPARRLGCMMHVRRHFYDALKLGDKRAAPAIEWIGTLIIQPQGL